MIYLTILIGILLIFFIWKLSQFPKIEYLQQLTDLLQESGLNQLIISKFFGLKKISLSTNLPPNKQKIARAHPQIGISQQITEPTESLYEEIVIKSPTVGLFKLKLSEIKTNCIQKGQKIEKGDIICYIESLNIPKEIRSETSGIIKEIYIKDGMPVEYGQPLMLIEIR